MLSEKDLTGIVYSQYGFTFAAAKTTGFCSLEFLRADGAFEYLGKHIGGAGFAGITEELGRLLEVVFDIKKLGESQKLKNLVDLRLNIEEHDVAAPGLYRFEEGGKRADTRTGHVVQTGTVE